MTLSIEAFNHRYPEGMPVRYHSIIGAPDFTEHLLRSEAWELPNGEPVVQITGKAGCVALAAVSVSPLVDTYTDLRLKIIDHALDCECEDCLAFIEAGRNLALL